MTSDSDPPRISAEIATVHRANQARIEGAEDRIQALRAETRALIAETEALLDQEVLETAKLNQTFEVTPAASTASPRGWAQLLENAEELLEAEGIAPPHCVGSLLSQEENAAITAHLQRPTYERLIWDKWDLLVAFGAGLAGAATDVLLATPGKFVEQSMAERKSWLGSWLESVHQKAPSGAVIDYQGPHFGGPHHRGLTTGHDLLRPLEGIRQFMDGVFRGSYYQEGVRHVVETAVNQYGKPYAPMGWEAAAIAWVVHNVCDFFSSKSLPIPGTSWISELPSRKLRVFVQRDLYQNGIHLRHLTLQTLAPLVVEVGVRAYIALRYRKATASEEAIRQKRTELLTLGHTLTVAINTGKLVVLKDPTMLNLPALIALLKNFAGLVLLEQGRHSLVARIARNADDLTAIQSELEGLLHRRVQKPILLS